MSTTDTTTSTRGAAVLSDSLDGSAPYTVHGVAIGPDEVTVGLSGQKKFWPSDALSGVAGTLSDKNIVKNHVNNDVDAVVGAVTEAGYHPQFGVVYEGEIDDAELAEKVSRGRLDVSPRIIHAHVDELEENDDGALVVDDIREFVNLALVPQGAAESNRIEIGESGMLSASDLHEFFDYGEESGSDADDLGAEDEVEIEEPVGSGEESAQESGEELGCGCCDCGDCGEDCGCDECDHGEGDTDGDELESEEGEDDVSVLADIEVLGADSREDEIDISELTFLN